MSDPAGPKVSIVVPAYNEAQRLPRSLTEMRAFFETVPFSHEILIVVEESSDGTLDLARQGIAGQANFRVIDHRPKRGKGHAVRCGMLEARGKIVFYMDADLSVPLEEIPRFVRWFDEHPECQVVFGNRKHRESRIEVRQSALRQRMGETFNQVLRRLAEIEIRDTQCGFKAFRQPAAREIFSRQELDGFAFDVEVFLLARALGYDVADLPVRWINSPESKVHIIRDSLRMLYDAIRVRSMVQRKCKGNHG